MIVVDTNVLSELMRDQPAEAVRVWARGQRPRALFLSAITEAEIRLGIALLPLGRRRKGLTDAAERMFGQLFGGRVLAFDSAAAIAYSDLAAKRRTTGLPMSQSDCQIAAICISQDAALATRNVRDFIDSGLSLIDPWNSEPN